MNNELIDVKSLKKAADLYYTNYNNEEYRLLFFEEIERQLYKKVIVPLNSKSNDDELWDFKAVYDGAPGPVVVLLYTVFSSEKELEKFGDVPFVEYANLLDALEYCRDVEGDLGFDTFSERTFIDSVSIENFFEYLYRAE